VVPNLAPACAPQALRSLETGLDGWSLPKNWKRLTEQQVVYNLRVPNPERMLAIKQARARTLRLKIKQGSPVPCAWH
jgi:hypothetical protein